MFNKITIVQILLLSIFSLKAFSSELDPEYRDSRLESLYHVLEMDGSLQIDDRAINEGANEWSIDVKIVELTGETKSSVEKSWKHLIASETKKIIEDLNNWYPNLVPAHYTFLSTKTIKAINESGEEGTVLLQQGVEHAKARKWLIEEIQTKAARANSFLYLEDSYARDFEYFRYHHSNYGAEVIGDDILVIRGVRKVIVIKISYTHS